MAGRSDSMSGGKSREDLFGFLDYLSAKGLIPAATARARKASTKQVLAMLNEEEASDVLALDLDLLMHRFSTKFGQKYTPTSLRDYGSRLRSSIEDFRSYTENPLGFRIPGRARQKATEPNGRQPTKRSANKPFTMIEPAPQTQPSNPSPSVGILPIRLRSDLTIQIAGLPFDLTPAEAKKIANIVLAHAADG